MKGYIEKIRQKIKLFPPRKEGESGEEYARQRAILGLKYGVFALTAFAILRGLIVTAGENVTVTNSVDGRELPIYCVDTAEKKIALSFDAAWGNEDTPKILEILKKHDIHVTFFMTGGWVESYPDDVKAILAAGACAIIMTEPFYTEINFQIPVRVCRVRKAVNPEYFFVLLSTCCRAFAL